MKSKPINSKVGSSFFKHLSQGLHNANSAKPDHSTVAIGFTRIQMAKRDLAKPRLVFYDVKQDAFYDQGDSTKIKKKDWTKINESNYKKDNPINNLQYYIPLNDALVEESDQC